MILHNLNKAVLVKIEEQSTLYDVVSLTFLILFVYLHTNCKNW